jgi:citrate lyase subunit beta / citryl-CoA lyase
VMAAVIAGGFGRREVVVRVNGQGTTWGRDDVAAVAKSGADAMLLPKVESARDLAGLGQALAEAGAPDGMQVWAMIETPLGILNVAGIAAAAAQTRLSCLVLGTNDLVKETRAELDAGRTAALYWLSASVTSSTASTTTSRTPKACCASAGRAASSAWTARP